MVKYSYVNISLQHFFCLKIHTYIYFNSMHTCVYYKNININTSVYIILYLAEDKKKLKS